MEEDQGIHVAPLHHLPGGEGLRQPAVGGQQPQARRAVLRLRQRHRAHGGSEDGLRAHRHHGRGDAQFTELLPACLQHHLCRTGPAVGEIRVHLAARLPRGPQGKTDLLRGVGVADGRGVQDQPQRLVGRHLRRDVRLQKQHTLHRPHLHGTLLHRSHVIRKDADRRLDPQSLHQSPSEHLQPQYRYRRGHADLHVGLQGRARGARRVQQQRYLQHQVPGPEVDCLRR